MFLETYNITGGTVTIDQSKDKKNERNYKDHAVHNEGTLVKCRTGFTRRRRGNFLHKIGKFSHKNWLLL